MSDLYDVVQAFSGRRYRYRTEVDLHEALAAALDDADVAYQREVRVVGGRIDFVVGSCGVEVKIKGSVEALRSQVEGYADDARLDDFLVVTTRPAHRSVAPRTSNGKRVRVLTIGGLSL